MSFVSSSALRVLIASGSLFFVGQSFADASAASTVMTPGGLSCNAGRYMFSIYNDSSAYGSWYVVCNNGYTNDAVTVYGQPYSWATMNGSFGGNVVCTITGNGYTVNDSIFCR